MAPALCDAHELAATYGITVESLRLYEARGLLRPVPIDGIQHYTSRDRTRLEIVLKGKQLGFSLEEIEKLVFLPASPTVAAAAADLQGLDLDSVFDELRVLLSKRDSLDVSIEELKTLLPRT